MSTIDLHAASVAVFAASLSNMKSWLNKAADREAELIGARLAPDMLPLSAQYQRSSDTAKNALARLTGTTPPVMEDTERSFAELAARCDRTINYLHSIDPAALNGADARDVEMRFPNGMGYRWAGATFLTGFALPNFFFHVSAAYMILRHNGVALGKPDFLQHLGQPNLSRD